MGIPFLEKILGEQLYKDLTEMKEKVIKEWEEKWKQNAQDHKTIAQALKEILDRLEKIEKK